ncbi:MAG: protein-methionine-sulfoxide reductase heme-binding subunit MsrQ [Rhodobacteraceae bacterium]|nr:protein-methionine-sulfoxide reductase heme-binding subunit MsrQ [Paracoccaceae bacterium]
MIDRLNMALRRLPSWPLYILGAVPAIAWFRLALLNRLGADPVRALEHEYGLIALQLLIAALCITPLREIVGLNLLRFRRAIGQLAFVYALLHFIVWLWLDRQFDWPRIVEDLLKRPYIIVGFAALLLLLPLALTSTDSAIRRLGGVRWRRLHRLAYPATLLAGLHFIWLVKAWPAEPLLYGAGIVLLLAWRAVRSRRKGARRAMPQKFRANEKKLS